MADAADAASEHASAAADATKPGATRAAQARKPRRVPVVPLRIITAPSRLIHSYPKYSIAMCQAGRQSCASEAKLASLRSQSRAPDSARRCDAGGGHQVVHRIGPDLASHLLAGANREPVVEARPDARIRHLVGPGADIGPAMR